MTTTNLFISLPPEVLIHILEYLLDKNYHHHTISTTTTITSESNGIEENSSKKGLIEYCSEAKLRELIQQINTVMTLHSTFSSIQERTQSNVDSHSSSSMMITNYMNDLWWRIFQKYCSTLEMQQVTEMNLLKEQMLKKGMKRCVSLFLKVRGTWLKKRKGIDVNRTEECKVVVLGDGGVGKSGLVIQFIMGQFIEEYDPTIEDSYRKQMEVDGNLAILDILDTAGLEEYYALTRSYLRFGECFVFVCAVDDLRSAHNLDSHIRSMVHHKDSTDVPCIFAINKIDLVRENSIEDKSQLVTEDMVYKLIEKHKLKNFAIFETSGKRAINSSAIFEECVRRQRMGDFNSTEFMREIIEHKLLSEKKKCSIM
ncbi:hypothetical protein FDP41_005795 [Naegleria fowleri]|uniref:Ras family small GTPase n=1 Tax=Naegleria fowleri TaxID=5763 RepID=A0A6A5BJJ4_NAEFO|nr:uncharacterized protein FDP41_005795 [Naegleria fowleri]KAF0975042.1 hypothetical protein FDP41_005795 [Naegleria fowleri]